MHPAPSVILFTVLSGAGFGMLFWLGLGAGPFFGLTGFLVWGLGYALSVAGLLASTFHLGNPQRSLLAFTQWRTSWLSREAWASVGALVLLGPVALASIFVGVLPPIFGMTGSLAAFLTVLTTSMIYTQLKTVPRWNHWSTPILFIAFSLAGGAILTRVHLPAAILTLALAPLLIWSFRHGDGRFAAAGASLGTATGLGGLGAVRQLMPPHTGPNYLMREMIHVVGRKHADRLRVIAVVFASLLPAAILFFIPPIPLVLGVAFALHLIGALAARWLFFAEAEHVVGLYYDMR